MPETRADLLEGSPSFFDSSAASLAAAGKLGEAWRTVLKGGPETAARGVQGDFAVGLREANGRVYMAVDRFAIRTLCYRVSNGEIEFASRADELVQGTAEIDLQAIYDYLYFHAIPAPRTIYKNVYRLPPGHFAVFEKGTLVIAPYWAPTFKEPTQVSFDELKAEFRQLLQSAVTRQLDGGKPGCFLSGGTDSSTVAGMTSLVSGKVAATYSIGFDAQGYDEMEFARIAAKHFKTEHHEYYVTPDDLLRSISSVASWYDQPFGNSSALPAYYCAKMAREDGVTKILAGDGGDELFGGNTRYAKQRIFGWYDGVPAGLRGGFMEPVAGFPLLSKIPIVRKAASYVNQAKISMPDRMMTYNLLERLGVEEVLTPEFISQIDRNGPAQQQRGIWRGTGNATLINRMLAFDWRYTLAECDLPKVVGTTSMAGLRVGFPMLDDELVAFSQRIPTDYKIKGFKLRWFFKEALRGFLPDEIIVKKKQGFGLPFGVWANASPALLAVASDSLHSLAERRIVRLEYVQALLTERLPEHPSYYGEMVWILMMLEQWLAAKAPAFRVAT